MSNKKTPNFRAGKNIAMKIPSHEYDQTVKFYRDIIGLPEIGENSPSVVFEFGDKPLWLEIMTDDIESTADYLKVKGVVRRDEIEPLRDGFQGFWITNPSGIIHLISKE